MILRDFTVLWFGIMWIQCLTLYTSCTETNYRRINAIEHILLCYILINEKKS
jgi:hypothetical protein